MTAGSGGPANLDAARRCGYTAIDRDGIEQPCDRPAPGWRWYQDCEHEDVLDVACECHANEGGRRLALAEAAVERVRALCDEADRAQQPRTGVIGFVHPSMLDVTDIRRALDPGAEPGQQR